MAAVTPVSVALSSHRPTKQPLREAQPHDGRILCRVEDFVDVIGVEPALQAHLLGIGHSLLHPRQRIQRIK